MPYHPFSPGKWWTATSCSEKTFSSGPWAAPRLPDRADHCCLDCCAWNIFCGGLAGMFVSEVLSGRLVWSRGPSSPDTPVSCALLDIYFLILSPCILEGEDLDYSISCCVLNTRILSGTLWRLKTGAWEGWVSIVLRISIVSIRKVNAFLEKVGLCLPPLKLTLNLVISGLPNQHCPHERLGLVPFLISPWPPPPQAFSRRSQFYNPMNCLVTACSLL